MKDRLTRHMGFVLLMFAGFFLLYGVLQAKHPVIYFQDKKSTVSGDFNGDGKKEKVVEKTSYKNMGCITRISFEGKIKIAPIIDTGSFVSFIRNEGDLDELPGDEITVYWSSCEASEWMGGAVYGYREGSWMLQASFSVYGNPQLHDYVEKDKFNPRTIIVEENFWQADTMSSRKKKIILK